MKRFWYKLRYAYYFYKSVRFSFKTIWDHAEAGTGANYDENNAELEPKDAVYEDLQSWRD